jgi:diguanylate cyclase (GGDEF)-like protein
MLVVVLAVLFAASAIASASVAVVGWRRRRVTPAIGVLAVVAAGVAYWSLADILAVLTVRLSPFLLVLLSTGFLAVFAVTSGFFCLSMAVVDRSWRVSRRLAWWLAVEPVAVGALMATNNWHHQFIRNHDLTSVPGVHLLTFGPVFWLHTLYSYVLMASGLARVAQAWWHTAPTHRRSYSWLLVAALPPLAVNIVGLTLPGRSADLTPIGFAATALICYRSLVHRPVVELVPVARQLVVDMIGDAVIVLDPAGKVIDANPTAERLARGLLPAPPASLIGLPIEQVLGHGMRLADDADAEQEIHDVCGRGVDLQLRVNPIRDRHRRRIGWVAVARDVTDVNRQRRELELANARLVDQVQTIEALRADLAEQAVRDSLTGLHNRRYLMEALHRDLQHARRNGSPLSLALLDVDHFKRINDDCGHSAGDAALIHLSRLLAAAVRPGETVGRHGGEEFVIVLPGSTPAQARARLDALREQVRASAVHVAGHTIVMTFSAGVSAFTGGEGAAHLLDAADAALYQAKHRGRNRVEEAGPPVRAADVTTGVIR